MRKGFDPRDFVLVAFGGGGPLYAADIARELSVPRVIVPRHPGITAAMGLLASDLKYETPADVMASARKDKAAARRSRSSSRSSRPRRSRSSGPTA